MKKKFKKLVTIFLALLVFVMTSCSSKHKEIVFLHTSESISIYEKILLEYIKIYADDLDYKFSVQQDTTLEEFVFSNEKSKNEKKVLVQEDIEGYLINLNEKLDFFTVNSENRDLISNININLSNVSYVLGVISGIITKTNSVSIVYSKDAQGMASILLPFIAGVKSVNLRAYDALLDGSNLFDTSLYSVEDKEVKIKEFLDSNRSDIVFYLENEGYEQITNYLKESKRYLINLNQEIIEDDEFKFINYNFEGIIDMILEGNKDTLNYDVDLFNDLITLNLDFVPEEIRVKVLDSISDIQTGKVVLPNSVEELRAMIF